MGFLFRCCREPRVIRHHNAALYSALGRVEYRQERASHATHARPQIVRLAAPSPLSAGRGIPKLQFETRGVVFQFGFVGRCDDLRVLGRAIVANFVSLVHCSSCRATRTRLADTRFARWLVGRMAVFVWLRRPGCKFQGRTLYNVLDFWISLKKSHRFLEGLLLQ